MRLRLWGVGIFGDARPMATEGESRGRVVSTSTGVTK